MAPSMSRYWLFPFRGTALLLVASFTLGLQVAVRARFMGIPLAAILLSWFFKYCFVLLDAIVRGDEEPPVLSVEMVNPVSEQRPIALGATIVLGVMLVSAVGKAVGAPAATLCASVLVFLLPASIAVLGLTDNPFKAVYPPLLFHVIRSAGRYYLLLNLLTLTAAGLFVWLARSGVPLWMIIAGSQLLFLLTFSIVAGVVFEHRHELGLDSRRRIEFEIERALREHVTERAQMIDRAYAKFRVNKPLEGWKEIEEWLARERQREDPRGPAVSQGERLLIEQGAIFEAALGWDDVRPADRLANELIGALLLRRENGQALEVLERRLAKNPQFRPSQRAHLIRLAELAGAAGKPALRRQLLQQTDGA